MKATDLMIGDWVLDHQCCPVKVDIDALQWANDYPLKPISLTTEILVKNGFEKVNDWTYKHPSLLLIFECYGNHILHYNSTTICEMHKVHTFQHALRLCELNDFADNFKV